MQTIEIVQHQHVIIKQLKKTRHFYNCCAKLILIRKKLKHSINLRSKIQIVSIIEKKAGNQGKK